MPFYQFTVPTGNATLRHKPEIAAAMTKAHSEVTGASGASVHCSFRQAANWPMSVKAFCCSDRQ